MPIPDGEQFRGVTYYRLPGKYSGWKIHAEGMNIVSSNIKGIKKHINTRLDLGYQVIDGKLHKPSTD